jgi:hypothetical protein
VQGREASQPGHQLTVCLFYPSGDKNYICGIRSSDRAAYSTPQTPSTSLPAPSCCLFFRFWSSLTLRTDKPTPSGPMIVQSTIAQVTTRKISDGSFVAIPDLEKMPFDSATPDIRNPISPRAHIAKARMRGGCMERGFGGLGELLYWPLGAGAGHAAAVWLTDGSGAALVDS